MSDTESDAESNLEFRPNWHLNRVNLGFGFRGSMYYNNKSEIDGNPWKFQRSFSKSTAQNTLIL